MVWERRTEERRARWGPQGPLASLTAGLGVVVLLVGGTAVVVEPSPSAPVIGQLADDSDGVDAPSADPPPRATDEDDGAEGAGDDGPAPDPPSEPDLAEEPDEPADPDGPPEPDPEADHDPGSAPSEPDPEPLPGDEGGWEDVPQPPFRIVDSLTAWTGERLLVVGGAQANGGLHRRAAAYDPASRSWEEIAEPPEVVWGGYLTSAHWSGRELLVVGYGDGAGDDAERHVALAYDPAADDWRRLARPSLPEHVHDLTTVWTGEELLLVASPSRGGRPVTLGYDPDRDRWREAAEFPVGGDRYNFAAIWTDATLVVWGGTEQGMWAGTQEPSEPYGDGAAYDPATDTWEVLEVPAEAVRARPEAWSGSEIIAVVHDEQRGVDTVLALSADLGDVRRLADPPARTPGWQQPVWTGRELVLVGDRAVEEHHRSGAPPPDERVGGVALDPEADRWRVLDDPGMTSESGLVVEWTGRQVVAVGGRQTVQQEEQEPSADAFAYTPPR